MNRNDLSDLYEEIAALSFCAVEANLYLDGHPNDREALLYLTETVKKLNEKRALYEQKYGPLTAENSSGKQFLWSTTPWPWQED